MQRRKTSFAKSMNGLFSCHVVLPTEAVRGLANSETVRGCAGTLSATALTCHLRRDDRDFVAFCFPSRKT